MNFKLSKIALAVIAMTANVEISTSTVQTLNSSALIAENSRHTGWNIGLSEAVASRDDNSIEVVVVEGDPISDPDPIWDDLGYNDGSGGYEGNDGGSEGGGSSGSSDPTNEELRENCEAWSKNHQSNCLGIAFDNYVNEHGRCQEMSREPDVTYGDIQDCDTEVNYTYDYDVNECNLEYEDDIAACERNFPT